MSEVEERDGERRRLDDPCGWRQLDNHELTRRFVESVPIVCWSRKLSVRS
jgi:hypothetical protein